MSRRPRKSGSIRWRAIRQAALTRDGGQCRRCLGRAALTVHHIRPRDVGGSDDLRNLVTLCATCHDWAEVETVERGLTWIELLRPPAVDDSKRHWFLDLDGRITAIVLEDAA